jgi:phage/plasmid-like protein (TIGR03299 family)
MSKETIEYLNNQTLIGNTDLRGSAWHRDDSLSASGESNHYPGPVPLEAIKRRLLDWTVLEVPVESSIPVTDMSQATDISADGRPIVRITSPDHKMLVRSDNHFVLGVHGMGYGVHEYAKLIETAEAISDDPRVVIESAGVLRAGKRFWIQLALADTVTVAGDAFRIFLSICSSHDATLQTTAIRGAQRILCDNTEAAALREAGESGLVYKFKHRAGSLAHIRDAQSALRILDDSAAEKVAQVETLTRVEVTRTAWQAMLDLAVPIPDEKGRGRTMAENKRDDLGRLYTSDTRVSPWAGTAWGVVQAFSTYGQHEATVRGLPRQARVIDRFLSGGIAKDDDDTLDLLARVLVAAR